MPKNGARQDGIYNTIHARLSLVSAGVLETGVKLQKAPSSYPRADCGQALAGASGHLPALCSSTLRTGFR